MGVYYQLYDILANFLYGNSEQLTSHMEFVLTELATIGCIAAVAVPFLLVFAVMRSISEVMFPGY